MKKGTKIGLGFTALLVGAMVLTGCTNSFCSTVDKAHILYAIDHGVTQYFDTQEEAQAFAGENGKVSQVEDTPIWRGARIDGNKTFFTVYKTARDTQKIEVPSLDYYIALDEVVLAHALEADKKTLSTFEKASEIMDLENHDGVLIRQGYLKYYGTNEKESKKLWENYYAYDKELRTTYLDLSIDECPTNDFLSFYKQQMTTKIASSRACLATRGGFYGNYGDGVSAEITQKDWGYAWKVGFLSGLLVYPIGWLLDTFTFGLMGGVGNGWAQLLAILFVTFIVRSLMLIATFKQTTASSKMQELQPEVAKIQAKYPNSNTNQYEKQRMAMETQALYKKHKINPFTSIIVMIVQFPVFICVWGAMQGSSVISTGTVLNLNLSQSIISVLTTWSNWTNAAGTGVLTALFLFLLMAGAQTVAMLLPQWLAKAKKKNVQKLGRNPAQKETENRTKWFTYIMLAMIIFMGFSLVSALGVYWLVGALFSIAQTLITHAIMNRKKKAK